MSYDVRTFKWTVRSETMLLHVYFAGGLPQTSPRAAFEPMHMPGNDGWHPAAGTSGMGGDFHPPPPPPYPGTGRVTPGQHMRAPYPGAAADHRSPVISPNLPPHSQGIYSTYYSTTTQLLLSHAFFCLERSNT